MLGHAEPQVPVGKLQQFLEFLITALQIAQRTRDMTRVIVFFTQGLGSGQRNPE